GHDKIVWPLAVSSDGMRVASAAGDEHRLLLWQRGSAAPRELPSKAQVYSTAFSPDGKWLAWSGLYKEVHLLSLETGELRSVSGHNSAVRLVTFSPDGRFLLSGSDDRTARLYSLSDSSVRVLHHDSVVFIGRFTPDAKTLITVCGKETLHVWDVE